LVVSGISRGDPIHIGTEMLIGPYGTLGEFKRIKVWSIHNNNKESVQTLCDRERGCLAIKPIDKKEDFGINNIVKGNLIISKNVKKNVCYEFTSDVQILSHSTVISPNYTPVIHCGIIRQTAKIVLNEKNFS
jgi:GTPase